VASHGPEREITTPKGKSKLVLGGKILGLPRYCGEDVANKGIQEKQLV